EAVEDGAVRRALARDGHDDQQEQHDPYRDSDPPRASRRATRCSERFHQSAPARTFSSRTGAETGSIGLRRRPGQAARIVPNAMVPPPIHIQTASGSMITRTFTLSPSAGAVSSDK